MTAKDTFRARSFGQWVTANGGRVLPTTSEWEVMRYRLEGIHVVHRNAKGRLTIPEKTWEQYRGFLAGAEAGVISRARGKERSALVVSLLLRDGEVCLVCGLFLDDDITLEHWLAVDAGGNNDPRNLGLAHEACNKALGSKPIVEKMAIRDTLRAIVAETAPWDLVNALDALEAI